MASEPSREGDLDFGPYVTLLAGAVIGVSLLIASAVFFYFGWTPLIDWIREGKEEKLWEPLLAIVLALLGEAVMFAAFQSARRVERANATMRRILYGYNAAFTANLLLVLLLLINIIVHIRYPSPIDTTAGKFYSLSEVTQKFVASLNRPVVVCMFLEPDTEVYQNTKTLLTEMQLQNPKYFSFEEYSTSLNQSVARDLKTRFPQFPFKPGLIVAVGPNTAQNNTFIDSDELDAVETDQMSGSRQRQYTGEVKILRDLQFLANEKKKPILYFTQGHGEPDLTDRREEGLATLRQRLIDANFDVRPLMIFEADPEKFSVPNDAEMVVVVGPKTSMADVMPALRTYMNPGPGKRKGKMLVFLGPSPPDPMAGNTMRQVGIEPFLKEFNVESTNEQVFTFAFPDNSGRMRPMPQPENILVAPTMDALASQHPIARVFGEGVAVRWQSARIVRPLEIGANSTYRAQSLLATYGLVWTETNMQLSPNKQQQSFITDADERAKRVRRDAMSVAVAVTESGGNPHAGGEPNPTPSPRLVVFGSSSIAGNVAQMPRANSLDFDLVKGSIEWCRERDAAIGVQPKSHQYFSLPAKASNWMLFYLPWLAMTLAIGGFGLIVWTVRRR
jgi:hypothetical protein